MSLSPRQVTRVLLRALITALKHVPRGKAGDDLMALLRFVHGHGRLPTSGPLLSDTLFRLKLKGLDSPLRSFVTDKEYVKLFVRAVLGEEYNVPVLAVLRTEEEVRRFAFPHRCVIKPSHATGRVMLRKGGEALDIGQILGWLSYDHHRRSGERNYRLLERKIIVEDFALGRDASDEYKIFCRGGAPRVVQAIEDRLTDPKLAYFDLSWRNTGVSMVYPVIENPYPRPPNLDHMLEVAAKLAAHFDLIRVDLYTDGTRIAVGELTNCHVGGNKPFIPPEGEKTVSALIFGGA